MEKETYKNSSAPIDERVQDLIERMTLEEKIRQINMYPWMYEDWAPTARPLLSKDGEFDEEHLVNLLGDNVPGVVRGLDKIKPQNSATANRLQKFALEKTRMGIPFLFISEGPHGYVGTGGTIFPQNIALASTFNRKLAAVMGKVIGKEARAAGITVVKGPILDVAQDPRWSRVEETFGEDPYLVGKMGVEIVKGMQGELSSEHAVVSMLKHFAAYGSSEGGHNASPVHMGERELREIALPPFEAAVREGNAQAVMVAYNEIDGIPCTTNSWLLEDVLRKEMGFNGFIQSDSGSIKMVYDFDCAESMEDAIRQSLEAGVDMQNYDFECLWYEAAIKQLIVDGKLVLDDVDRAVSKVLRVKFELGLFENPYVEEDRGARLIGCPEHSVYALEAARESVCLLKNEGDLLPLSPNLSKIAVIGPNADRRLYGSYIGFSDWDAELAGGTVLESIRKLVAPDTEVLYAKGCELINKNEKGSMIISAHTFTLDHIRKNIDDMADVEKELQQACDIAKDAEVAILVLGEAPWISSSEGMDRADVGLTGDQLKLAQAVAATGTPTVVVLMNGRPLAIPWIVDHLPAIVEGWYPGQVGGQAIAEVLFGGYNPAGRLPVSFPNSSAQLPIYYNHKYKMRKKYMDMDPGPLYSFGYGLSYTRFAYSELTIDSGAADGSSPTKVSVKVTNEGDRDGDEVVQLYVRDVVANITPRAKMLKGFERIHLTKGASAVVTFELQASDLAIVDRAMKRIVEPGEFEIMVGGHSEGGLNGKLFFGDGGGV